MPDDGWTALAASCPSATIFHHPAWSQLLTECYGYRPVLLKCADSTGRVVAGLPVQDVRSWLNGRRAIALPFSDHVPPLAVDDSALAWLVSRLQEWREGSGLPRLEVHAELPLQEGIFHQETVAYHTLALAQDPSEVDRRFKKRQVRQHIRQAVNAGVTIHRGESQKDLELFYGLHLQTRRRLGTPVQPLRFFRLLWDRLLSQGLGFVLLAYKGSQLLAGGVFLHWNGVLTYKYSASDQAYWRLSGNNLLMWHAIQWGCEHGYRLLDWGRTDLWSEGLLDFKRAWGTDEQLLSYSVLADQEPSPKYAGRSRKWLSSIIERSPAWVCRGIGEVLYGHYA